MMMSQDLYLPCILQCIHREEFLKKDHDNRYSGNVHYDVYRLYILRNSLQQIRSCECYQ